MPPKFTLGSMMSFATHPHWSLNALLHPGFDLANVAQRKDLSLKSGAVSVIQYLSDQIDRTVDLERCGMAGPGMGRSIPYQRCALRP